MKFTVGKLPLIALFAGVLVFGMNTTALAHVVVKPAEAVTAGFQTFTMSVPNEKELANTKLKLLIPEGLKYVQPTQKVGWKIDIEKSGTGLDAVVKSITWSGGTVNAGFRDDFTFSGQVPEKATELQWKAYQTYSDGTLVSWDKVETGDKESEDENSGPLSVTKVVAEATDGAATTQGGSESSVDAKNTANTALYIAVAGVLVGLAGVYLATRNTTLATKASSKSKK